MSVLKTYSIHIRRLSQHIPYGTPAEELLDDLSILHDCQDIIEASQREALRAVRKKFDALGTIPEAKRDALLSELDEVFRDSQTDALADTLDYWAIEMRSMIEDMGEA